MLLRRPGRKLHRQWQWRDLAQLDFGSFRLDYPTSLTSLSLDRFAVRYQSLGANGRGSGTGFGTPPPSVPEPATWAMMLAGFGATGFAMRRTRRKNLLAQIA